MNRSSRRIARHFGPGALLIALIACGGQDTQPAAQGPDDTAGAADIAGADSSAGDSSAADSSAADSPVTTGTDAGGSVAGDASRAADGTSVAGNDTTPTDAGSGAGCSEGCDDNNPCTNDSCVADACVHSDNTEKCDDGDACTGDDKCGGGACAGKALYWERTFGGSDEDIGNKGLIINNEDIAVAGSTRSAGAVGRDAWLLRIDVYGDLVWQKPWGGAFDQAAHDVARGFGAGGYVLAGRSASKAGKSRATLCSTDKVGAVSWQPQAGQFGGAAKGGAQVVERGGNCGSACGGKGRGSAGRARDQGWQAELQGWALRAFVVLCARLPSGVMGDRYPWRRATVAGESKRRQLSDVRRAVDSARPRVPQNRHPGSTLRNRADAPWPG